MEFNEIVAPTLKELFVSEITKKIISGDLVVGEKLPPQRIMEAKMKVSKTIINSGLKELEKTGFITIEPRVGAFVADYTRNGNIDTLLAIINFHGGLLDRKTFDSLMAYRLYNDSECAYLAAKNRTSEDVVILRNLHKQMQTLDNPKKLAELKLEFQKAIYYATQNNIYSLVCNSFSKLNLLFSEIVFNNIDPSTTNIFMQELIDAIENKQSERAGALMSKLMKTRIDQLEQYYFD